MHRRSFLAGVATAGAAAFGGCSALSGDGGGGGGGGYGQVARWALAPSDREQPSTNYTVESLDPAAALAAGNELEAESLPATYGDSFLWRQLPAADHERVIEVDTEHRMRPNHYRVFEGGLDVDRVTSAFADAPNYDPVDLGGYEEYQCFDTGPGLFLHAVTDGRAIEIDRLRQNDVDRNELERVVDAGAGDAERIGDRHDGVAVVANRLEPRHFSTLRAVNPQREPEPANGVYAGVTASGASAEVRDEETHMRAYLTFRDEAALEAVDTGPWIEASQEAEGVSELDVESDGRVLTIELTSATERLFGN